MQGGRCFVLGILVVGVMGVGGKPRVKRERGELRVRRKDREESKESCVQISAGLDLPDHCKEYCIAIRSLKDWKLTFITKNFFLSEDILLRTNPANLPL